MKRTAVILVALLLATPCFAEGNDANTMLLLHCDGADTSTTFPDVSVGGNGGAGHGNAGIEGNAQVDTGQKVFGTGSYQGDGAGSAITFVNNADWQFGANNFTIDFRFRHDGGPAFGFLMMYGTIQFLSISWSADNIQVWLDNNQHLFTFVAAADTWYHVALVRNGNDLNVYKNGVDSGTTIDVTGQSVGNANDKLTIAAEDDISNAFDGWIDEIRISDTARWTVNFTPPTEAYNGVTGASQVIIVN